MNKTWLVYDIGMSVEWLCQLVDFDMHEISNVWCNFTWYSPEFLCFWSMVPKRAEPQFYTSHVMKQLLGTECMKYNTLPIIRSFHLMIAWNIELVVSLFSYRYVGRTCYSLWTELCRIRTVTSAHPQVHPGRQPLPVSLCEAAALISMFILRQLHAG